MVDILCEILYNNKSQKFKRQLLKHQGGMKMIEKVEEVFLKLKMVAEDRTSIKLDLLSPKVAVEIAQNGYNIKNCIYHSDKNKSYTEIYTKKVEKPGRIEIEEVA